jgi:hypothetical protein
MSIFRCEKCGCVENTALSNYHGRRFAKDHRPLCSECDPEIAEWHGEFPKESAEGMLIGADGYLYDVKPTHTKVVGKVPPNAGIEFPERSGGKLQ